MEQPADHVGRFLQKTQDFRLFLPDMRPKAPTFSQQIYEQSRNKRFDSFEQAYTDWTIYGQRCGLEFDTGKSSLLKVVLKVKDEPEFLPLWISYYSNIVGRHNIIIVDCGSNTRSHLDIISELSSTVLVLSYSRHYDDIHHISSNVDFYDMISSSCKYISVLDADEFLFGHLNGNIGASLVETILRDGDKDAYACTWFPNDTIFTQQSEQIVYNFNFDDDILMYGSIAGKTVLRSHTYRKATYIGHNLHLRESLDLLTTSSFGKLGVLHITKSESNIARQRSLKHLKAKGVVTDDLKTNLEIESHLMRALSNGSLQGIEAHYAQKYIGIATAEEISASTFEASLNASRPPSPSPYLSKAISEFDFAALLEQQRDLLGRKSIV